MVRALGAHGQDRTHPPQQIAQSKINTAAAAYRERSLCDQRRSPKYTYRFNSSYPGVDCLQAIRLMTKAAKCHAGLTHETGT